MKKLVFVSMLFTACIHANHTNDETIMQTLHALNQTNPPNTLDIFDNPASIPEPYLKAFLASALVPVTTLIISAFFNRS